MPELTTSNFHPLKLDSAGWSRETPYYTMFLCLKKTVLNTEFIQPTQHRKPTPSDP